MAYPKKRPVKKKSNNKASLKGNTLQKKIRNKKNI